MMLNKTYSILTQAWKLWYCLLCLELTYIHTIKSALYISLKLTAAQANTTKNTLSDQNNVETLYNGLKSNTHVKLNAGNLRYCLVLYCTDAFLVTHVHLNALMFQP